MARVYATEADYVTFSGRTAPADIARQLTRASELVEQATKTAVYDVDSGGLPTDPAIVAAMRDAVCAVVDWWAETGDEKGAGGRWKNVSIGRVSLSGGSNAPAGPQSARERIGPQAATLLDSAGLLSQPPLT